MAARAAVRRPASRRAATEASEPKSGRAERAPRVVYAEPPLRLGAPVERLGDDAWRVRIGAHDVEATLHPSVDPALVAEVAARGGRVIVEQAPTPVIAGVLQTARALTMDARGDVRAQVRRLDVTASERVLLKTPGAFASITGREIELYSGRVLTRAREIARVLAGMIRLN